MPSELCIQCKSTECDSRDPGVTTLPIPGPETPQSGLCWLSFTLSAPVWICGKPPWRPSWGPQTSLGPAVGAGWCYAMELQDADRGRHRPVEESLLCLHTSAARELTLRVLKGASCTRPCHHPLLGLLHTLRILILFIYFWPCSWPVGSISLGREIASPTL